MGFWSLYTFGSNKKNYGPKIDPIKNTYIIYWYQQNLPFCKSGLTILLVIGSRVYEIIPRFLDHCKFHEDHMQLKIV